MSLSTRRALRTLVLSISMAAGLVFAQADPPEGYWTGAYTREDAAHRAEFTFRREGDAWTGVHSVEDLCLEDAVTDISATTSTLTMGTKYGAFSCIIHPERREITGSNENWNPPMKLHLKRSVAAGRRWVELPFAFNSGDETLAASIYKPLDGAASPRAVVVLGHGSAQGVRHDLRRQVRLYTRLGCWVVGYDRRGEGESSGEIGEQFPELAKDMVACVEELQRANLANGAPILLSGASQGGWIVPIAAESLGDRVQGLILLSSPATTVTQQEIDRVEATARAEGLPEEQVAEAKDFATLSVSVGLTGENVESYRAWLEKARKAPWSGIVQLDEPDELALWKKFEVDPAPMLKKLSKPTIAIYGGADTMVPSKNNAVLMEEYLKQAPGENQRVHVLADCDHSLIRHATLVGGEWNWPLGYWSFSAMPPDVYELLDAFIASIEQE